MTFNNLKLFAYSPRPHYPAASSTAWQQRRQRPSSRSSSVGSRPWMARERGLDAFRLDSASSIERTDASIPKPGLRSRACRRENSAKVAGKAQPLAVGVEILAIR